MVPTTISSQSVVINCPTEEGVGFREFRVYLGADLRIYKLWAFRIEFLGLAGAEA